MLSRLGQTLMQVKISYSSAPRGVKYGFSKRSILIGQNPDTKLCC